MVRVRVRVRIKIRVRVKVRVRVCARDSYLTSQSVQWIEPYLRSRPPYPGLGVRVMERI